MESRPAVLSSSRGSSSDMPCVGIHQTLIHDKCVDAALHQCEKCFIGFTALLISRREGEALTSRWALTAPTAWHQSLFTYNWKLALQQVSHLKARKEKRSRAGSQATVFQILNNRRDLGLAAISV
jgi:hypothetical protein